MNTKLRLGTRRSILAMAQSRQIANELERRHPGLEVQLVGLETRGDRTLDVPLSQMEGKDFFVAELDGALLTRQVDLTVHSMKDLSIERPGNVLTAAIPRRANPRDAVLFAPDILERLKRGKPIRLGTSSPRRLENVPPFLRRALPAPGNKPDIVCREIRGNVTSRLGYLRLPEDDPRKIDAVVLALAGLLRLRSDAAGAEALATLLPGLRWMILPLRECPAAPAQGALAVECRADDAATAALLAGMHCAATAESVARERALLQSWGGGCHQRVGATAERLGEIGTLFHVRGRTQDNVVVAVTEWDTGQPADAAGVSGPTWDGSYWRQSMFSHSYTPNLPHPDWASNAGAVFVAHSRAVPGDWCPLLAGSPQRIWTSGTASWFRLAERGLWIEGCAEEGGFAGVAPLLQEALLGLPPLAKWRVLTHSDGLREWPMHQVIATYRVDAPGDMGPDHPAVRALRVARSVFWTSGSQFRVLREWIPASCSHACRFGKTYNYLREHLEPADAARLRAYPDVDEWRASIRG